VGSRKVAGGFDSLPPPPALAEAHEESLADQQPQLSRPVVDRRKEPPDEVAVIREDGGVQV
jgi:hypothetical protein